MIVIFYTSIVLRPSWPPAPPIFQGGDAPISIASQPLCDVLPGDAVALRGRAQALSLGDGEQALGAADQRVRALLAPTQGEECGHVGGRETRGKGGAPAFHLSFLS